MSEVDMKQLQEMMTQVRLDIRELTTEVRSLKGLGEKVEEMRDKILNNGKDVKAAHLRLDAHDKIIEEIREGQNWMPKLITGSVITTIIGGLIGAAITKALGG